jgi:hypothetical protein
MSAFGERPGMENQVAYARRRKSGLETPLAGRFYRERLLVFSPPLWYDILVGLCVIAGGLLAVYYYILGSPLWLVMLAVMFAGIWGAISNERMVCDLRSRTYARFEGIGIGKRIIRGNLTDLDALVLTSEQYGTGIGLGATVIYRLVIYWKGMRHPPLVAERQSRSIPYGAPLNQAAGAILQRGTRFSQALQVKYFDNSHMAGKSPVPTL